LQDVAVGTVVAMIVCGLWVAKFARAAMLEIEAEERRRRR